MQLRQIERNIFHCHLLSASGRVASETTAVDCCVYYNNDNLARIVPKGEKNQRQLGNCAKTGRNISSGAKLTRIDSPRSQLECLFWRQV